MNVFGKDWGCGHKNEKNDDEIQWWDWLISDEELIQYLRYKEMFTIMLYTNQGGGHPY